MIYLGADHGGFKHKEKLKKFLSEQGYQLTDLGTNNEEASHYPKFALEVAKKVIEDPNNRGILLCRNGVGMSVVANKIKGVRAALAWDKQIARSAREDDSVNVLCLPADFISEEQAKEITKTFLDTSFEPEERYKRRLQEIEDIEKEI